MHPPAVLCPVDFSEGSRGAVRYATAIAAHFGAELTLLAVNDPLLYEALALAGDESSLGAATSREVDRFFADTFDERPHGLAGVHVEVAVGKPAPEILRIAADRPYDLIVMSSHGATGFRKLFFGSTTERVLRETTAPVLVTPGETAGPVRLDQAARLVRRVLAPVDLSPETAQQAAVAGGVAEALAVPLLLLHVVEPVRAPVLAQSRLPSIDRERRSRAERALEELADAAPRRARTEALVAYGETAEEIAKVAADRDVGLIVMGLHASPVLGPRMGSVTYRVLCLVHQPILALPPSTDPRSPWRPTAALSAQPPSPRPPGA
jgi:nucleotide-binding universal stress UspA family protein